MRLRAFLIGVGILVASVGAPRADFLVGAQVGAGPLTLTELEDFWESFDLHHDDDPLALYWELSTTWRFARRHAVCLSIERITTSVALHAVYLPAGALWSEQKFETIPVCVSYEFSLVCSERGASTWLGVGGGFYMTEVEGNLVDYIDGMPQPIISNRPREGDGYGFHGYLRQTAPVTERLSLSGMVRGRWADGMAFEDDDAIPVEFTGLDVSIGLEWKI